MSNNRPAIFCLYVSEYNGVGIMYSVPVVQNSAAEAQAAKKVGDSNDTAIVSPQLSSKAFTEKMTIPRIIIVG